MDIWKHGTYVDMWSIVHLLSGFVLAGLFFLFGFSFPVAIISSVFLLLFWEVFEAAVKIIEPSINVIVDIIIGFVGFLVGAQLFYVMGWPASYALYGLVLTIALATWGFVDFLKRGYR